MPLNYENPQQPAPQTTRYEQPKVLPPFKSEKPVTTPPLKYETNNQKVKK